MEEIRSSGKWSIPCTNCIELNGELYLYPSKNIINLIVYSSESIGLFNEFDIITGKTTYDLFIA